MVDYPVVIELSRNVVDDGLLCQLLQMSLHNLHRYPLL